MDIKNILSCSKRNFLEKLYNAENCKTSQYFMEAEGYFDKKGYSNYINCHTDSLNTDFEQSLFFRACPFVGHAGCTINFVERPHPCNLYLCRSLIKYCKDTYSKYCLERKDYFSYCNYFDEVLKEELISHDTDLIKDFNKSLDIIESIQIPNFSPRKLNEIYFDTDYIKSKAS